MKLNQTNSEIYQTAKSIKFLLTNKRSSNYSV